VLTNLHSGHAWQDDLLLGRQLLGFVRHSVLLLIKHVHDQLLVLLTEFAECVLETRHEVHGLGCWL